MKVEWEEGSRRIRLGDNTGGGAAMLQPIRCRCVEVSILTGIQLHLFPWNYWALIWNCDTKLPNWLKSDKNINHFSWRPQYVPLLPETQIRHQIIFVQCIIFYTVGSNMFLDNTYTVHCYVYIATMITQTRHNLTLYVVFTANCDLPVIKCFAG